MTIRIGEDKLTQMIKQSVAKYLREKDVRNKYMNDNIHLRRFSEKKEEQFKDALMAQEDIKIINAEDTADDHPDNSTTWKAYWEGETKVKLEDILPQKNGKFLCPGHEYHKDDDGYVESEKMCGCHVQKVDKEGNIIDKTMYITPMCSGCNQRKEIFKVGKKALVKR